MSYEWHDMKESILEKWDKLSHNDLDQRQSNWFGIIDLIKSHYPHDKSIPEDFWAILQSHDESWYVRHPTSPRSSETSELQDEIGNFKRTRETEAYLKRIQRTISE